MNDGFTVEDFETLRAQRRAMFAGLEAESIPAPQHPEWSHVKYESATLRLFGPTFEDNQRRLAAYAAAGWQLIAVIPCDEFSGLDYPTAHYQRKATTGMKFMGPIDEASGNAFGFVSPDTKETNEKAS